MKKSLIALFVAVTMFATACNTQEAATTEATTTEAMTTEAAATEAATEAAETEAATTEAMTTEAAGTNEIALHRHYGAPHGDRGFGRVVVAMAGDKIVDVAMDEFQYFAEDSNPMALPNQDGAFGEGAKEGMILGSKLDNNDSYSAMMAEKAGSTVTVADNFKAIIDFVKGKTVAEVEEVIANAEPGKPIDAVSGATLADTAGYLQIIVDTVKDTSDVSKGMAENVDAVTLSQIFAAPHGDKAFGDAVVAKEGDKIVVASFDEFQYSGGVTVPSSDGAFGENYADPEKGLSSKMQNSENYSKSMAEKAGSTVTIVENFNAIENFVAGKTVAEIEETIAGAEAGKPIDAVSGATLVDTAGYLQMIVDAAK